MIEQLFEMLRPIGSDAALFIVSLIPFIELRGGILLGHGLGMDPIRVFLICFVANCIPVPFVMLLSRPIFEYLKKTKFFGSAVNKLEKKLIKKSGKVLEYKYTVLGIIAFVGIPLPGTGAYTGALIASLLGMRLKQAIPAIAVGIFSAGVIMTLASMGIFGALNIFI